MAHELMLSALPYTLTIMIIAFIFATVIRHGVFFSRSVTLIAISYGASITEIFLILLSLIHIHSVRHIHFHLMMLINHDDERYTSASSIPLDHLLIFAITIATLIITISFVISQIAMHMMKKEYSNNNITQVSDRISTLLPVKYRNSVKLFVIPSDNFDAFSFTLLDFNKKHHLHAQNFIIITSSIIDILDNEELKMVINHELSHINEKDTRYTHFITALSTIMFFDPFLRFLKRIINEEQEILADKNATKILYRPKKLASALVKSIDYNDVSTLKTHFSKNNSQLILKRIELLLKM